MTQVLLFHHALGVTPGILRFAEELRGAGHEVVVPDLFDGALFDSIATGVAYAERAGFEAIADRGVAHVADLDDEFVVAGFSLGVLPAQKIAQTQPGVAGAILYHGAVPSSIFGDGWPQRVALQIHLSADDEWATEDLEAARDLAAEAGGELFIYPGSGHLIADSSFGDFHPEHAALIMQRTLAFLAATS